MMPFGRRCEQHRDALLDFVDRREIAEATGPALDHLSRCSDCIRELEMTALAIVGLRRLYDDIRSVEPPTYAWERLRARVTRPATPTYAVRSPVMGMLTAMAIVIAVTVPGAMPARPAASPEPSSGVQVDPRAILIERELTLRRQPPPGEPHEITILVPLVAPPVGARLVGPDGRGYRLEPVTAEPRSDLVN
jgi:hypothetical protein